jgi:hypothetical protein
MDCSHIISIFIFWSSYAIFSAAEVPVEDFLYFLLYLIPCLCACILFANGYFLFRLAGQRIKESALTHWATGLLGFHVLVMILGIVVGFIYAFTNPDLGMGGSAFIILCFLVFIVGILSHLVAFILFILQLIKAKMSGN